MWAKRGPTRPPWTIGVDSGAGRVYNTRMASRLVGASGVAVLGLLALGCGTVNPSGPPPGSQAVDLSADACAGLIRAVDLATPETIDAVERCRFTDAGADAAKVVLTSNPTSGARWAALWVYAASDADPGPLLPYLASDDPSVAAMAAATVVAFGDRAGFPGLAKALDATQRLDGSKPPMSIQAFAFASLLSSVVVDEAPVDAEDWQDWLDANESALVFDGTTGMWGLP
jgi:hypothetical protein